MRTVKCTFLLLSAVLIFSCSKEKESDQDFTPVTGEWIDIFDSNAEWRESPRLGALCTVTDEIVNMETVANGTVHFYLRKTRLKKTEYFHLPADLSTTNSARLDELNSEGYVLKFDELPENDVRVVTMFVRGLVIPEGKKAPEGLDMDDYEDVADFFEIID
ncbi:MAG: hypothetical protein GX158_11285 [Bacteroidales bacterium]|jgi:hypothetical protein|nr:hypothetical protein [Bacteroidales bacterium]